MIPFEEFRQHVTRRHFLSAGSHLLGGAALASLTGAAFGSSTKVSSGAPSAALTHFAPKAKQVIYLHMVGGPSQLDLFDYKPVMRDWYDKDLPESVRNGQRLTTMTSGQARFHWVAPTVPGSGRSVTVVCGSGDAAAWAIQRSRALYMSGMP